MLYHVIWKYIEKRKKILYFRINTRMVPTEYVMKEYIKPMDLFSQKELVFAAAPMVRYSKLQFRALVRRYNCDLAFTPMIVSRSFVQSSKARDVEFTTNPEDRPLIVQFAANNGKDLADAAELVYRWALAEKYGAYLINEPELVRNMVLQLRNRIPDSEFTTSLKIRIHHDIRKTIEFCQRAEHCGVSWLTIHGRTIEQRKEPVNLEAIRTVVDSVRIPVLGNGDVFCLNDAKEMHEITGVKGVMSARGILQNPAMFAGYKYTPSTCIKDWLDISMQLGTHFTTFHQHLMFMLEKILPRSERKVFNVLTSISSVIDYLDKHFINEVDLQNGIF
ncbi:tRNA-dihydrouridine(20a/20b) synthase [NAD(P)+]-like isoform X3 [Centruroides sculpturatus]|uniref:tRNA-dihydrouridine(20a/20b) synthase [NAD(P)+]-like isoform X3 n=1 Tax=Centruroides sculpturatus TaxID=218467 RepID=UPI000C6DFA27|nr:tRNA-dihydrouridine(20a/20b) synthase [NAD(P)+]-like isoform X3 [Centruroides sculpturatus]